MSHLLSIVGVVFWNCLVALFGSYTPDQRAWSLFRLDLRKESPSGIVTCTRCFVGQGFVCMDVRDAEELLNADR